VHQHARLERPLAHGGRAAGQRSRRRIVVVAVAGRRSGRADVRRPIGGCAVRARPGNRRGAALRTVQSERAFRWRDRGRDTATGRLPSSCAAAEGEVEAVDVVAVEEEEEEAKQPYRTFTRVIFFVE